MNIRKEAGFGMRMGEGGGGGGTVSYFDENVDWELQY